MNPETAKIVASFLCTALASESAATRKVIQALPDSKLDWQPHDKGMKAGELAWHTIVAEQFFLDGILTGEFHPEAFSKGPATVAEMIAYYDNTVVPMIDQVAALSGEQLARTIGFHGFSNSGVAFINLCNVHGVHHRGQLSTYVRSLGEKVPAIYGESADSKAAAA